MKVSIASCLYIGCVSAGLIDAVAINQNKLLTAVGTGLTGFTTCKLANLEHCNHYAVIGACGGSVGYDLLTNRERVVKKFKAIDPIAVCNSIKESEILDTLTEGLKGMKRGVENFMAVVDENEEFVEEL